ncbi:MAG: LamG-like jellyroll fold domain-containing protein [Saprospiraceae bacterium]|nr:LamG-like jellyroll fold domain-containing protein [Saprospiraceae bacterium]
MHRTTIFYSFFLTLLAQIAFAQSGQISLPRVDLMPNQPAPYNVRNWKQVAIQYDSFVYDLQKSGQHLPLSSLGPGGVNYPQNPTFRLHTYIGTNSPLGNEAINVLPSLVAASLVGADKTNQFGRNWLLMSQDFFNKANGENIYLNNAGASSGGDWWYDMMPNVFFYQLYDLYPNLGTEANVQFSTIADRFLEAVRAMGGSDAPWEPAYMNYRAWKFKTMEPNANGVKEPEAAGAFAWVLYNAWKKTGNPEYLKGAEWSIEFLNDWTSNPSYELQLPYGTYTAAKMNAELGTNYDIQKMVNWSFDRGSLRGWGTIVGTWGGFDVSGLVGEANDAGNDYAFQLNGVQQAAALVPMVRYDKRFARAIGKWVLNLSNATRLCYPGFLPANLQDASTWSNTNDPQQVMGYEALRQKFQNLSPYSTGDAVQGGWAATNLALYGTGSIGYLGAMVEKTNVDKILKLDLLKTDFYGSEAYPTYLIYNSHPTAQSIQFAAGNSPADIYESLSETFVLQNVSGTVNLSIPANQAIIVTICPSGGAISFEKNKMLVNGVVVDFDQHAQAYTNAPRIKALAAGKNPLEIGDSTTVYATVEDTDSGQIKYEWSAPVGTFSGSGANVIFHAPANLGNVEIRLIAADPEGNRDTAILQMTIVAEINDAPQILEIQKSVAYVAPSESLQLTCLASDANNDPLSYVWTATGGTLNGTGNTVEWTAPASEGIFDVTVNVSDDEGLFAQTTVKILVKNFNATPGDLVSHYPFTGNANDVSGNQLHGQANGAILTTDQNGGQQRAYYFNGGVQNITVSNDSLLNFQDGITVSCWFKANALPEKESFLLSHGSWQNRWKLSITPEKYLRWTVNTLLGIADLDMDVPIQTDQFYHVAATYDGSLLALYLNGNLHTYKVLSGKIRTTTFPFLMGQMLPAQPEYNFKGVMDAVKIHNYALVPDGVKNLFEEAISAVQNPISSETQTMELSPNPVSDVMRVRVLNIDRGALNPRVNSTVQVRDLAGRVVLEKQGLIGDSFDLNVGKLKSGVYTVLFHSEKTNAVARFAKL